MRYNKKIKSLFSKNFKYLNVARLKIVDNENSIYSNKIVLYNKYFYFIDLTIKSGKIPVILQLPNEIFIDEENAKEINFVNILEPKIESVNIHYKHLNILKNLQIILNKIPKYIITPDKKYINIFFGNSILIIIRGYDL